MRKTPDDAVDGKRNPDGEANDPNSFVGLALFSGGREAGNQAKAVGDGVLRPPQPTQILIEDAAFSQKEVVE